MRRETTWARRKQQQREYAAALQSQIASQRQRAREERAAELADGMWPPVSRAAAAAAAAHSGGGGSGAAVVDDAAPDGEATVQLWGAEDKAAGLSRIRATVMLEVPTALLGTSYGDRRGDVYARSFLMEHQAGFFFLPTQYIRACYVIAPSSGLVLDSRQ
jgi:hypothetical protein